MKTLQFLLLLISVLAFSQNDMKARIEYEEAETAFAAEDYSKAITHLVEAEKLLGKWTPKVSYLMIVSLDKTLDNFKPNSEILEHLLQQINTYMNYAKNNSHIDTDKFREIYKIDQNLGKVMHQMSNMYNVGLYVAENEKEAMKWRINAAEKGFPRSMYGLGVNYHKGTQGVGKDYKKALELLIKAYKAGENDAVEHIISIYDKGGFGIERNEKLAEEWRNK